MSDQPVVAQGASCVCGQRLPWHLFDLVTFAGVEGFSSHCSCDRRYTKTDGVVHLVGVEKNVIAEWDRTHAWDKNAVDERTGLRGAWLKKT